MTSNQPTLLVLAAGMGTRYGGLKQLESIGPSGETLMDYSIYDARKAGFERVVFLIRKEMQETFEEQVGRKYKNILDVEYAYQDKDDLPNGYSCPTDRQKPWGTGHAVWATREVLSDCSFGVINADDYYGAETFFQLIDTFSPVTPGDEKLSCAMVGFQLSETLSEYGSVSRGICKTQGDRLLSVEEWTGITGQNSISGKNSKGQEESLKGNEIVSMNVWAFPKSVFSYLQTSFENFLSTLSDPSKSEFYLPTAVDEWIQSGKVEVIVRSASCEWIGVTYQEDKPRVVKSIAGLVNNGKYPSPLLG
jgi:UTP-glucose-1-phosphate uridylyltransferase